MIDQDLFWMAIKAVAVLSFSIQFSFFLIASIQKTDLYTDLAYGLSFVTIVWWLALRLVPIGPVGATLVAMVTLWGLRIAGYLFIRILAIKKDKRFDGIRESSFKFGMFWILQAVSVWLILLPTIHGISINRFIAFSNLHWIGVAMWAVGLLIESVSDWQKFQFKQNSVNADKWIGSGLWKYSRHPNYFGELLCWWGIFMMVVPQLDGWSWITIAGPLTITILLLFISGIPTLEKKYDQKYAHNRDYQRYKQTTSLLIPWPTKR